MKRFAAHRLYLASEKKMLAMQVVELDEQGDVHLVFPLEEEIRQTEWLGGMIVIAAEMPQHVPDESFSAFLARLSDASESRMRAWHIMFFDMAAMEFTLHSRIIRLR